MSNQSGRDAPAEVLDHVGACSLDDLCVVCRVEEEFVAQLVEHGALDPVGISRTEWRFASVSIARVSKAKRLERDLGLNTAGVALALDLLAQIDELRARLRTYEGREQQGGAGPRAVIPAIIPCRQRNPPHIEYDRKPLYVPPSPVS